MEEIGTLIYFGVAPRGNGKPFLCGKLLEVGEEYTGRPIRKILQFSQGKMSAEIREKVIEMVSIKPICELLKRKL